MITFSMLMVLLIAEFLLFLVNNVSGGTLISSRVIIGIVMRAFIMILLLLMHKGIV